MVQFTSPIIVLLSVLSLVSAHDSVEKIRRKSTFKVPLTHYTAPGTNSHSVLESDRVRIAAQKGTPAPPVAAVVNSAAIANAVVSYIASIGVGSPPNFYQLIVDTGSSNTWVGAGHAYVKTKTSVDTKLKVAVTYGSGSFSGEQFTDEIQLVEGLTVTGQGLGVAKNATGFSGVDGILGVGPEILTEGTLSSAKVQIPTIIQTAFTDGKIKSRVLGVYFQPTTIQTAIDNGELTYGGIDTTRIKGSVHWTPVTKVSPASFYWGIDVQRLASGKTIIFKTPVAGIVDTGTTLIYLATEYFDTYLKAIPKAKVDSKSGLVQIPESSLASMPDLTFTIAGKPFTLNKYAQLVETGLYTSFGLEKGFYYSWVNDLGQDAGQGLDFIIGQKFLERFYSVFDTDNARVGFALTAYSSPTTAI